jgi:hypothetical protein
MTDRRGRSVEPAGVASVPAVQQVQDMQVKKQWQSPFIMRSV